MGCGEEIQWDIPQQDYDVVVVDAILTNEFKYHSIFLSSSRSDANQLSEKITGAKVYVSDGINTLEFKEDSIQPGKYTGALPFAATVDRNYHLQVDYKSETYEADEYMIPVIPSNRLVVGLVDTSSFWYEIKWIAPEYSQTEQAMYEVEIDWSHLVNENIEDSISRAKIFHYSLNTLNVSYTIFPQDKEKVIFPKYSRIVERKYSLTDEYATFLRALLAETEWQGSLFEEARGNLPTNISNDGLGYFSVCSVLSDTIVVE